jgi:cytochrome c-type biogenesis protein CcmH/NrfG
VTEPDIVPSGEPTKQSSDAAQRRQERSAADARDRIARSAQDEVTLAFDSHAQLRQSVQSTVQSLEKALQQCLSLDKKCSSRLGRQLFLGRRLLLKPTLGVLGSALHHLKKVGSQMDSASRLKEAVLEEASDPELDH